MEGGSCADRASLSTRSNLGSVGPDGEPLGGDAIDMGDRPGRGDAGNRVATLPLRVLVARQVVFFDVVVALLFLTAGRLDWLGGWLVAVILVMSQVAQWLVIGRRHLDLLVDRSRMQSGADRGDVPLATGMAYGPYLAILVAALEVRLQGLPTVGPAAPLMGLLLVSGGIAAALWAMRANRFFAPIVRIQVERGHTVEHGGPYRYVRHPGYAGAIAYYAGLVLVLGSWWAVPIAVATALIAIARTTREDAYLRAHLAGYVDYAARVRWRLLPRVW